MKHGLDALTALVEGAGGLEACAAAAKKHYDALEPLVHRVLSPDWPPRSLSEGPPLSFEAPPAASAARAEIAKVCGKGASDLRRAVSAAVANDGFCSVYGQGSRPPPALDTWRALARAHVVMAREEAKSRPALAIESLFELILVGADLARGGAPYAVAIAGIAVLDDALPALEAILESAPLTREEATLLVAQAEKLIASEPSMPDMVRAERVALDVLLSGRSPDAPVPFITAPRQSSTKPLPPQPADVRHLAREAAHKILSEIEALCVQSPRGSDCLRRFIFVMRREVPLILKLDADTLAAAAIVSNPAAARATLSTAFVGLVLLDQIEIAGTMMLRPAYLAGVRLHLALRALDEPAIDPVKAAALPEARDPLAMGPLMIETLSPREAMVRSTAPIDPALKYRSVYWLRLPKPVASAPAPPQ